MFKFVRKNKKLIGVVFGVILMVMFLSQLAPQGTQTRSNALQKTVATLDGQKVSLQEIDFAKQEWQELKTHYYLNPSAPNAEPQPLLYAVLGDDFVNKIDQAQRDSTPLFYLLVREAERQGVIVTKEEVENLVANNVVPAGDPGTPEREDLEQSVADLLKVIHLINRVTSVIKISRPYQDYQLARMGQELAVKIVWVSASSYQSQVPEPTEAQIQAQYDQFHDRVAARPNQLPTEFGATDDPLGFGYKTPNRVQLQYIGVNVADVHQAAIASKSEQDWYVAAFGEFQQHRDEYDSQPVAGAATQPASTQPSANGAQKLPDLKADFALHVPAVLEQLYEDQTRTMVQEIRRDISEKMSAGFGAYRDAVASGAKSDTGAAGDYTSYKFMQDLADSIRAKYGVNPLLGDIQQLKNIDELGKLSGIGPSRFVINQTPVGTFPDYAIRLYQPWLSAADKSSTTGALALTQWQPSNAVENLQQGSIFIFRITGSESEHVPALADVKPQVIADWKTAAGYAKALDAGHALLASAAKEGLDRAAVAAHFPAPILTQPFDAEQIILGHVATISPLQFSPDSIREIARQSQQLLVTPTSADQRPQLVAQLYADRIVSVIELNSAEPSWNEQDKSDLIAEVTRYLTNQQAEPLRSGIFDADAVKSRMNFVSLEKVSQ